MGIDCLIRFGTLIASKDFLTERLQVMVFYFPMTMGKKILTVEFIRNTKQQTNQHTREETSRIYINGERAGKKKDF